MPLFYVRDVRCLRCGEGYVLVDVTDDPDGPVMIEPVRCPCGGRVEPVGEWR